MQKGNGGFLITQIKQIQGRVFERLLSRAGITEFNGAQGRILYVLWQKEMNELFFRNFTDDEIIVFEGYLTRP